MKFKGGHVVESAFKPFSLLSNQHAQTLWPTLFRPTPSISRTRERLNTEDNDFIDLDWFEVAERPLIILIHGLAGSSQSKYITGLQLALSNQQFASVAVNLRGCSGEPNRRAHGYHGGVSHDLDFVIKTLRKRFPRRILGAVGFSLGANILLKWLSEAKGSSPLFAAVSVSTPFQLNLATEKLQQGFAKIYDQYLLSYLKLNHWRKFKWLRENAIIEDLQKFTNTSSIWKISNIAEYDEYITAPLHGYKNASEYYQACSSRSMVKDIQIPTLILSSKDDPFMPIEIIPTQSELSPSTMLEISEKGGHVGFIGANYKGLPTYWLEERIPQFLNEILEH